MLPSDGTTKCPTEQKRVSFSKDAVAEVPIIAPLPQVPLKRIPPRRPRKCNSLEELKRENLRRLVANNEMMTKSVKGAMVGCFALLTKRPQTILAMLMLPSDGTTKCPAEKSSVSSSKDLVAEELIMAPLPQAPLKCIPPR